MAEPREALSLSSPAGRWVLLATILGSALAGIDATELDDVERRLLELVGSRTARDVLVRVP